MVRLVKYAGEEKAALPLIQAFWKEHNEYEQTAQEAREDLNAWTGAGNDFYFIEGDGSRVGFMHLGSRGAKTDWLEDLFVLPAYQRRGIGSKAVQLAEEIVREYSQSLYIEAAARNEGAIRLYKKLGYDCLNTITVRKDFPGYEYDVVRNEQVCGEVFQVRKSRKERKTQ